MYCEKCGKELKDTAKFCPFCGSRVEVKETAETKEAEETTSVSEIDLPEERIAEEKPVSEQETAAGNTEARAVEAAVPEKKKAPSEKAGRKAEKPAKKKSGKAAIIAAAAVVVAGAAVAYPFYIKPSMEYAEAEKALIEGRYSEAAMLFDGLDGFSDSADRADEASYAGAVEKMSTGDYAGAKTDFELLADYADSSEMKNQCDYKLAEGMLAGGDHDGAAAGFLALGDYSDSAVRYAEAVIAKADALAEEGKYAEALEAAEAVNSGSFMDKLILYRIGAAEVYAAEEKYEEAAAVLEPVKDEELEGVRVADEIKKYNYYVVCSKIEDGTADEADAKALAEGGVYMDSAVRLSQLCYDLGVKKLEASDYRGAAEMFRNAGNYNDASAMLNEALYGLAGEYTDNSDFNSARNLYSLLGAYKDSPRHKPAVSALAEGENNGWNVNCASYSDGYALSEFYTGDTVTVKGSAGNERSLQENAVYVVYLQFEGNAPVTVPCTNITAGSSFVAEFEITDSMQGTAEIKVLLASTGTVLYRFNIEVN